MHAVNIRAGYGYRRGENVRVVHDINFDTRMVYYKIPGRRTFAPLKSGLIEFADWAESEINPIPGGDFA